MERLPLEGYRVVDFGWVAAAPQVGGFLADMGAEVIKVESSTHWDTSRFTPDNVARNPNKDPWFHCINRGKLGITLNLSRPEAIELAKKLITKSDIVIENFTPGVMKRLGLDYESLKKIRPDIIMISMSACGQYGGFSDIMTYGPSLNGLAGLDSLVGYRGERVLGMQQPFADFNAPLHATFALLVALYRREKVGEGTYIDLAQLEPVISVEGEAIMEYTMNHRVLGTLGNFNPIMAPHNNYRCKGEDNWVSIAIKTEEEWQNLCQAIGNPPWTKEERFSNTHSRLRNLEELDKLVTEWTSQHTDYEVMEILQNAGVAAVVCMDIEKRYFDRHFTEREVFHILPDSEGENYAITAAPYKIGDIPRQPRRLAPMVGEHNSYVFGELLHLTNEEITHLQENGVIV